MLSHLKIHLNITNKIELENAAQSSKHLGRIAWLPNDTGINSDSSLKFGFGSTSLFKNSLDYFSCAPFIFIRNKGFILITLHIDKWVQVLCLP